MWKLSLLARMFTFGRRPAMVLELMAHRGDVQTNTRRVGFFLILRKLRGQDLMLLRVF